MIAYTLYICVCLCLVVLQTTMLSNITLFDNFYDILIPFILYLGLFRSFMEGLPLVLIFGYAMDSLTGGPFGIYITVYFWLFIGVRGLKQYLHAGSILLRPFVIGAGVLFENITFVAALAMLEKNWDIPSVTFRSVFIQTLWAVCTGPFLLMLIDYAYIKTDKWIEAWSLSKKERMG